MSKRRELKALPSRVIMPDGDSVELGLLGEEEREEILERVCRNISYRIGIHYASRIREWKTFVDVMRA